MKLNECRYVVAGRQAGEPLQESPYLMHPVECNTVGLYKTPVAILDFASLYPSLYRAHNLCYSTLLHPDDVTGLPPEHTTEVLRPKANVKSHFVKPELRKGILPSILAALIEARATTRASLKEATDAGVVLCTLGSLSCCALPAVLACCACLMRSPAALACCACLLCLPAVLACCACLLCLPAVLACCACMLCSLAALTCCLACCACLLCLPAVLACWACLLGLIAVGTLLCLLQNLEAPAQH